MTDDPLAVLLKFGFLAVLYLFLFWVARSALRDLSPRANHAALDVDADARGGRRDGTPGPSRGLSPRLEVVAAPGHRPGAAFDVREGAVLGRSGDIPVEDPYASSAHARIFPRGEGMFIEDMGSTNGTYLNGRALRQPEPLRASDTVRIGDTEFRYQE